MGAEVFGHAVKLAVSRPNIRFVPLKSAEQQSILTLHRVRQGFVVERTATINRIRGLIAEFDLVLPQRMTEVRRGAARLLGQLPSMAPGALAAIRSFYFDTALSAGNSTLSALMQVVDPDHILFGTDFPFAPVSATQHFGDVLESTIIAGFGKPDVYRKNGARLLGRPRNVESLERTIG